MHEEQGVGQVFPRAPGISEALFASGLLPAQASAEDPQVPPTAARASVCLLIYTQRQLFFKHINTSAGTRVSVHRILMFLCIPIQMGVHGYVRAFLTQLPMTISIGEAKCLAIWCSVCMFLCMYICLH